MDAALAQLRHRAARPPARLRAGRVARGAATTSARWRAAANFAWANRAALTHRVREAFAPCWVAGSGARTRRSTTWPTTSPSSSAHGRRSTAGLRPPQGGDARLPARPPGDPAGRTRGRPAGDHPRQHGHGLVVLVGRPGAMRALVRHDLPRRRPGDVPHRRAQGGRRRRSCAGGSRRPGSSSGRRRPRGWPRRRPRPTRTSTGWSRSSSAPASPHGSRACDRWVWSRADGLPGRLTG